MDIALYTLSLLFALLGIIGAIIPLLPGAILSFVALLIAFVSSTPPLSLGWLFAYLGIGVAVMVIDTFLPIYMTKLFGGSKGGAWGATIGMLVGFVIFPPVGIILCPLFGAILGELLNDKSDVAKAFKVGMGSFAAFLAGTAIKFFYSLWILWLLVSEFLPIVVDAFQSLFQDKI